MAKEPRVESNIYDLTGSLAAAPADDGYPIVGAVFTPAGPIEKRKVTSQKEFIDNYLLSSTILPTDNDSIKFIFKLLELNPVYLMRACPLSILEGISSTGTRLLFDKGFNLIPQYKKFRIEEIVDLLNYYDVTLNGKTFCTADTPSGAWEQETKYEKGDVVTYSDSTYRCIADHTSTTEFNTDYWAELTMEDSGWYRIGDHKSLDLLTSGLADFANQDMLNPDIISSSKGYISSLKPISGHSANIGKFVEIKNGVQYARISSSQTLQDTDVVSEQDNVHVGGYTYWFYGTGVSGTPSNIASPIRILSPNNFGKMSKEYFLLKVMAAAELTQDEGYGRLSIHTVESGSDSGSGEYSIEFTSTNIPGLHIASGDDYSELVLTSNHLFLPDSLAVPGTDGKFGYIALKINDPEAESTAKYRYRVYTWGGTLDKTSDSYFATLAALLDTDISEVSAVDADIMLYNLSTSANSTSTAAMAVAAIDKLIGKETRIVTTDGKSRTQQIYSCANGEMPADYYPILFNGVLSVASDEGSDAPFESNFFKVIKDSDIKADFYQYYLSTDSDNDDYRTADFISLKAGSTLYYTGNLSSYTGSVDANEVAVNMASGAVSLAEFNKLLQYNIYINQSISVYNGYYITADTEMKLEGSSNVILDVPEPVVQRTMDQFAIVQKFPALGSIFQFSYAKDSENDQILDLKLNYKSGTSVEDWTMSFVPGVVNGYGIDQFYTRVDSLYFKVVNLAGDGNIGEVLDSYSSPAFGSAVAVPEYNVQYMKDAIQTLPDYEDNAYYYLITDSGVINPGYAAAIQTLCSELHSWYPVSLPDTSNTADLISWAGSAGLNSYYARMLAASDRMEIAGFSSVMPGSFKLIQSVLSLYRSQSNEFAPNYDLNHGTVGMSSPTQTFKRRAREKLLDYRIETLKGGVGTDYYINDNVTAQKSTSYMSENQNVLMTIVAIHECDRVARSYKAELNTAVTRKRLEDALNAALQARLFRGKAYAPYSYYAVCDATNNPLQVINNNQLVADIYAQFTPSSKVIILNHYIIPLTQS